MEAIALHSYSSRESGVELSFQKDNIIKIINYNDDPNWYEAELDGKVGWVPKSFFDAAPVYWFMGLMDRMECEKYAQVLWLILILNHFLGDKFLTLAFFNLRV